MSNVFRTEAKKLSDNSKSNMKTKPKDKDIPLTVEQYSELERALQWPEDLEKYDKVSKPTNLNELSFLSKGMQNAQNEH